MIPAARMTIALGTASAYSAFPSAWYHLVQDETGWRWTTSVLFAAHGVAQVVAMTLLARPGVATRLAGRAAGAAVAVLLLADAVGAALLAAAPAPGGFALLLVGRVVTGVALGALTTLATGFLARGRHGTGLATVAILGAVGVGSLTAGALAASGWSRSGVLALGLVLLPAAAWLVHTASTGSRVRVPVPAGNPATPGKQVAPVPAAPGDDDERGPDPGVGRGLAVPVVVAFLANGVLGLFCSTLPGVIAGLAGGASAVAGATTGLVMVSAGGARLLLARVPARPVAVVTALAAVVGVAAEIAALAAGHVVGALTAAALLGAAAGVGFDTALRSARRHGVPALARVQRGGQLGLVLPVLAYPVVAG